MAFVSVLMTAFNRERYIAESIESVLSSAYQDFELIIVDDCSSDGTVAVAKKYGDKDARIRIFTNEKNLGQFQNRNRAAGLARGKYIKYVDSDDILYKHALATMVEAMEKYPEAGFGVFSNTVQDNQPYPYLLCGREAFKQYYNGSADVLGMGPIGVIFRRDAFEQLAGFTNLSVAGDTDLLLRMALRYPVVKIGPSQFWWRRHADQAFRSKGAVKEYTIQQYLINRRIIQDAQFPMEQGKAKRLLKAYTRLLARSLCKQYLLKGEWKNARDIIRSTDLHLMELVRAVFPL